MLLLGAIAAMYYRSGKEKRDFNFHLMLVEYAVACQHCGCVLLPIRLVVVRTGE